MVRVAIIFGGRSGEHEISLASARAIVGALRRSGSYEVLPVGITREGDWIPSGEDPMRQLESLASSPAGASARDGAGKLPTPSLFEGIDVVFPVLHGPYGEDGTVQGMLDLAGVPYVGSGVLASAVGMDKISMKKVFAYHGLPQVTWLGLLRERWQKDREGHLREIEKTLGYPCFVKPSNLGSSVGINKATDAGELAEAVEEAASFDRRVIVEAGVEDARELEVSVLGNQEPEVSVPGEISVVRGGFYDYEAKYTEGGMQLHAPAEVPAEVAEEIGRVARAAYSAVDAAGMARVDFFLGGGTDRLLLNEINTIPGFTPTSVYARLWATSGLPYEKLLDRLIELALERHVETTL